MKLGDLLPRIFGITGDASMPADELRKRQQEDVATRFLPLGVFFAFVSLRVAFETPSRIPGELGTVLTAGWLGMTAFLVAVTLLFQRRQIPPAWSDVIVILVIFASLLLVSVFILLEDHRDIELPLGSIAFLGCCVVSSLRSRLFLIALAVAFVQTAYAVNNVHVSLAEQLVGNAHFVVILLSVTYVRDYIQSQLFSNRWQLDQRNGELDRTVQKLQEEITERNIAEGEIRRQRQQLQSLSRQLLTIQEKERTRISRELHDELGQELTATKLALDAARKRLPPQHAREIDDAIDGISESIHHVRGMSMELRPALLDHLGLEEALKWIAERIQNRTGIIVTLQTLNGHPRFPLEIEATSYRIAQEAITNALRHAETKSVRIYCENTAEHIRIRVEDDGKGFDPGAMAHSLAAERGLGLLGMRERAEALGGKLTVSSQPGAGTSVEAEFCREFVSVATGGQAQPHDRRMDTTPVLRSRDNIDHESRP